MIIKIRHTSLVTSGSLLLILTLFLVMGSCKKKDTNRPEVKLNGDNNIYLVLNTSYTEPGATATDPEDGEVSVSIEGEVNTELEGTYEITYSAYDQAGNRGSATRWVHVYNEGSEICGNFSALTVENLDTLTYHAIFSTSTTWNNRVWIVGYGKDSTAVVYADLADNAIVIPTQEYVSGGIPHYFSGTGTVSQNNGLSILVNYTDSIPGTVVSGNTLYERKSN